MTLLEVSNLHVDYRVQSDWMTAVHDVSFNVERSETLGIVGESGCGKSTLAFSLMRLLPANARISQGQIMLNGQDITQMSANELRTVRWNSMSMVFQAAMNSLNPVMRIGDIMKEALLNHEKLTDADVQRRCEKLLEMVDLDRRVLRSYPHELSGGMKQRVVIAMSLLCNPDLLIADEPTTALDVVVQSQILGKLKTLAKELDIGLIVISHDLGVIADTCDWVAVMYAAQVVEYGDVYTIFKEPRHPYTIGLMSSIPNLHGPKQELISLPGSPPNLLDPLPPCRFESRCTYGTPLCQTDEPPVVQLTEHHLSRCHYASDPKILVPLAQHGEEME